ncbi:MAG: glycosyltransferase [Eubacteriales bacterium]
MDIIFAHDHKFRVMDGEYYSTGGLSNDVLTRYTNVFGNVTVICRTVPKQINDKNLSKIINKNVFIVEGYNNRSTIKDTIKNADAVIVRLPSIIGNVAVRYAKYFNKPYLVEIVGCPLDSYWNHSIKGKIVAPYFFLNMKAIVKRAPYSLYVTNKFLQKRYPCNGRTIGCSDVVLLGTDEEVLKDRIRFINNRKKDAAVTIGTIAAVDVKYKGQEYIIRAIAKLKKEGYNFEYCLVGGGNYEYLSSVAKKLDIKNNIKFLGTLPHNEVFSYLDTLEIYAQPSLVEGLPRALIEAMSRGCPAIGSVAGGITELLDENCVFHKGAVDEICEILKSFTIDKMKKEAKRSFEIAQSYRREVLDKKRKNFYKEFAESVGN